MQLRSKVLTAAVSGISILFGLVNPASAGVFGPRAISAPTLDEAGLIGLGVVMGVIGLVTLIRRKK